MNIDNFSRNWSQATLEKNTDKRVCPCHPVIEMDMEYKKEEQQLRKIIRHYNIPCHAHFLTFSCYQQLPLLNQKSTRHWVIEAIIQASFTTRHKFSPANLTNKIDSVDPRFRLRKFTIVVNPSFLTTRSISFNSSSKRQPIACEVMSTSANPSGSGISCRKPSTIWSTTWKAATWVTSCPNAA